MNLEVMSPVCFSVKFRTKVFAFCIGLDFAESVQRM